MSAAALHPHAGARLAVAIASENRMRRGVLSRLVEEAGHRLVEDPADADVILAEGGEVPLGLAPVVALGGPDLEQAGLISASATAAQIDAALRAAAAGLSVRVARHDAGFSPSAEAARAEHALASPLTPREVEVLTAIGEGLGNKAIARKLSISLHTVKFHVESIFRKLEVKSRAEAVARGLQWLQL